MAFTADQLSLCFQTYWYVWLTNSLGSLIFIGLDIGVAAFFLKKFGNNKLSAYQRSPSVQDRPFSRTEINSISDLDERSRSSGSRGASARSNDSTPIDETDDFSFSTCEAINKVRLRFNASPVVVNEELSIIAQQWAERMAHTGKLEHTRIESRNFGRQALGENYLALFQTELTASKMVRKWMKEERKYNFGQDGNRHTENFTQLVWQSTQEIGVGRARSPDGNWSYGIVVFDPPGNIPNQYARNVSFPRN